MIYMVVVRDDGRDRVLAERWFRTEDGAFRFNERMCARYRGNPHISIDVLLGDSVKEIKRAWPECFYAAHK